MRTNHDHGRRNQIASQNRSGPNITGWSADQIHKFVQNSRLENHRTSRFVGVATTVGIGTPGVGAGIGFEITTFVGVDTKTGMKAIARFRGIKGTIGASLGIASGGLFAFAFTGSPEEFAGASIGGQLSGGVTGGASVGTNGKVLVYSGAETALGAEINIGATWLVEGEQDGVKVIFGGTDAFLNGRVTGPAKNAMLKQLARSEDKRVKTRIQQEDGSILIRSYQGTPREDGSLRVAYRDHFENRNGEIIEKNPLSPSAGGPTNYFDVDARTLKAFALKSPEEQAFDRRSARLGPERAERYREQAERAQHQPEQHPGDGQDLMTGPRNDAKLMKDDRPAQPAHSNGDLMTDAGTEPQDKGHEGFGMDPPGQSDLAQDKRRANDPLIPMLRR